MNSCFENDINSSKAYLPNISFNFQYLFNEPFSIFGLTFFFEDILILAIAFFLFMQEDCDMLLVAVLVLILLS